jgi:hypothetical protein
MNKKGEICRHSILLLAKCMLPPPMAAPFSPGKPCRRMENQDCVGSIMSFSKRVIEVHMHKHAFTNGLTSCHGQYHHLCYLADICLDINLWAFIICCTGLLSLSVKCSKAADVNHGWLL